MYCYLIGHKVLVFVNFFFFLRDFIFKKNFIWKT